MSVKNIVVLHGERHIARLVQVNLERQGFTIHVASSPSQALEMIATEEPDMIVADSSMQFLERTDIFKLLRRQPSTARIPIYILPKPGANWMSLDNFPLVPALKEYHDDEEDTLH